MAVISLFYYILKQYYSPQFHPPQWLDSQKKKEKVVVVCSVNNCLPHFVLFLPVTLNPSVPKSDQHQFSPNNISRSSRVKVMRITKLITKGRMLWSQTKFSQLFFEEMYGNQFGECVCGSWSLKSQEWSTSEWFWSWSCQRNMPIVNINFVLWWL